MDRFEGKTIPETYGTPKKKILGKSDGFLYIFHSSVDIRDLKGKIYRKLWI